jgi:hypothetical protein
MATTHGPRRDGAVKTKTQINGAVKTKTQIRSPAEAGLGFCGKEAPSDAPTAAFWGNAAIVLAVAARAARQ